jgi:hypothetical protein
MQPVFHYPSPDGTTPVDKRLISIICFTHTCQVILKTFTIKLFLESTRGKGRLRKDAFTEKVTAMGQIDYPLFEQALGNGCSSYHATH